MKKFLALLLTGVLAFGVVGCGGSDAPADDATAGDDTAETVTIKVGAVPTPHSEVLAVVKDVLAEQGIILEVVEFNDYVQPNLALDSGDLDANYFQHQPYLDDFNEKNATDIVPIGAVHFEPMAIYSTTVTDLADIPEGSKIGVPNDGTNGGRALLLLQDAGVIKLSDDAGISATKLDIVENPLNLEVLEMEAAQLPLSLGDLSIAVINGNYAIQNGLATEDALSIEGAESVAAQTYANVVAVNNGDENRPELLALIAALNGQEVADFINNTYEGAVAPVF